MLGIVAAGYTSGGFNGPILLVTPLVPVIGTMLLGPRAGWLITLVVIAVLVIFAWLNIEGALPQNQLEQSGVLFGRFVAISFSMLIAMWVISGYSLLNRRMFLRNKVLADTDYLTGLANRRAVSHKLEAEASRARRTNEWLSLILTDIDSFKRYNDTNGHPVGDLCLQRVANMLTDCVKRPTDLVGRYGGEKFIIVLPNTDASGATMIAEAMRRRIYSEQIAYEPNGSEFVSLTLGVVSTKSHSLYNVDDLLKEADKALYEGKDQGKNRSISKVLEKLQSIGFEEFRRYSNGI